jgi:hypothetical protein
MLKMNTPFLHTLQNLIKYRYQRYLFHIHSIAFLKNNKNYDIKKPPSFMPPKIQKPEKPEKPENQGNPGDDDTIVTKKGHGGGKNTNREGKGFEALTDNIPHLIEQGFEREQWNKTSKHAFTLSKIFYSGLDNQKGGEGAVENIQLGGKRILYLCQGGFKAYMEKEYGLNYPRNPDEAYLILYADGRKVMKILEKKAQSVEGSADTKLMAANAFRQEYMFFSEGQFEVEYAFCLSDFFKEKFESTAKKNRKYLFLRQLLKREGIEVFYGEDADYFERLGQWIHRDSSAAIAATSSD